MIENNEIAMGQQVGDYRFDQLISSNSQTLTWEGEQVSVQRKVIITSLKTELMTDEDQKTEFLSHLRIKAQIDHPQIGSILEAVTSENHYFYAMDKLHGDNFGFMYEAAEPLTPLEATHILKSMAEVFLFLESQQTATMPMTLYDFFIHEKKTVNFNNLTILGHFNPDVATCNKQLIGTALDNLLAPDLPGATRMKSLFSYMVHGNQQIPLLWDQILSLAIEVEQQLLDAAETENKSLFKKLGNMLPKFR
ncbi:MAG: hypothetical protein ACSHX0_01340 [Akkermansiaceae bacterium]